VASGKRGRIRPETLPGRLPRARTAVPDWRNNRIDFAHLHSLPTAVPDIAFVIMITVTRLKRRNVLRIFGQASDWRRSYHRLSRFFESRVKRVSRLIARASSRLGASIVFFSSRRRIRHKVPRAAEFQSRGPCFRVASRKSGVYRYSYRIHGRCPRYKGPLPPLDCRTKNRSVHPCCSRSSCAPSSRGSGYPERGESPHQKVPCRSRDADIGRRFCAHAFITESAGNC